MGNCLVLNEVASQEHQQLNTWSWFQITFFSILFQNNGGVENFASLAKEQLTKES